MRVGSSVLQVSPTLPTGAGRCLGPSRRSGAYPGGWSGGSFAGSTARITGRPSALLPRT